MLVLVQHARRLLWAYILVVYWFLGSVAGHAQPQVLDRVLAVVDEEIILESELEQQYDFLKKRGQKDDGTLKCTVFENLLTNYLLLAKAKQDSIKVSSDQVEGELNRRISVVLAEMGGEENVLKVTGKTVVELKVELRKDIENQLLIEEQKRKVLNNVEVTPKEVKEYYKSIPVDSLPLLPAEVELRRLVIKPTPSDISKAETKERLEKIRAKIEAGELTFEQAARQYSEDYGSAKENGFLGEFTRGRMVPQFEEVAYNSAPGQLSKVFESPYGFHILKVHTRLGDKITASHILLRPRVTMSDELKAKEKINSIRAAIARDSISFDAAARLFSEDRQTKEIGGMVQSQTGEYRVPLDQLDADLYLTVDNLKPGQMSESLDFIFQDGGELVRAYQLIYLTKRHAPHQANLKDDYAKFQAAAKQARQAETLQKWFERARKQVFFEIKEHECSKALANWN
jgi:peptidyl-prolyl cis-trans isomerase SurA